MTLFEIPSDVQQMLDWGLRGIRAVLEASAAVIGEFWAVVARFVGQAAARMLPVLSQSQQDALITVGAVVGSAVALVLVIGTLRLLVLPGNGGVARLRQRHR